MRGRRFGGLVLGVMMAQGCGPCGGDAADEMEPVAATTDELAEASGVEGAGSTPEADEAPTLGSAEASADEPGADPSQEPATDPVVAPIEQQQMRSSSCAFQVHRLVVASAVEDREPVPILGDVPATEDPVYVYAQFGNAEGPETTARFEWAHAATDHTHEQTMDVGVSPTWRTWVRHRLLPTRAGSWTVRVFDAEGCQAGAMTFEAVAS